MKIEDLFNEKVNKERLYNKPTHNEHRTTKICPYVLGNKKPTKDEYYGKSVL